MQGADHGAVPRSQAEPLEGQGAEELPEEEVVLRGEAPPVRQPHGEDLGHQRLGLQVPQVLPCDVSSDEQIAELGRSLDAEFGGLDCLVHGAAFAKPEDLDAPFSQTSREGFRVALDVSAYSFIALAREVRPLMQKRGGGSMLTLTYLGSERVFKNYNVMGVAKAALESSVRYLAAELGPDHIRVNAISAGPIKTLAAMGISGFSNILGHYREHAPLRKNTETTEVADAAMFLLSPAGRGVTAEILMVDAGFSVMGF